MREGAAMVTVKKKVSNAKASTPPAKKISDSYKEALINGRAENKIIRDYLVYTKANKPKRGRKRTAETITRQLDQISAMLKNGISDPVQDLKCHQQKLDLERDLQGIKVQKSIKKLESDFIKIAASYSNRNGISRAAWLCMGVSDKVLKSAGVK